MPALQVADWFKANPGDHGVTRLVEPFMTPMLVSNVWHVRGRDAVLVIDTGNGVGRLRSAIDRLGEDRPVISIATHGHFDHTGGLHEFDDRRCHEDDAAEVRVPYPLALVRDRFPDDLDDVFAYYGFRTPDVLVDAVPWEGFDVGEWSIQGAEPTSSVVEGDVIDLGDRTLEVLHVPGHTPGSIAVWEEATGLLFTGDMLYADDRLSFDDHAAAITSLARLRALPLTLAHPGHGRSIEAQEFRTLVDDAVAMLRG
jgi:glyoxylase-like metal-dependent hydrolase (beta-lactamase superfamily II)